MGSLSKAQERMYNLLYIFFKIIPSNPAHPEFKNGSCLMRITSTCRLKEEASAASPFSTMATRARSARGARKNPIVISSLDCFYRGLEQEVPVMQRP